MEFIHYIGESKGRFFGFVLVLIILCNFIVELIKAFKNKFFMETFHNIDQIVKVDAYPESLSSIEWRPKKKSLWLSEPEGYWKKGSHYSWDYFGNDLPSGHFERDGGIYTKAHIKASFSDGSRDTFIYESDEKMWEAFNGVKSSLKSSFESTT